VKKELIEKSNELITLSQHVESMLSTINRLEEGLTHKSQELESTVANIKTELTHIIFLDRNS
jgi:hypothetical protein